ncbi:MAG: phenylalanine--tRNA ligase subunit beta [Patescibacteria group bacterium]|nr:phenylalanine--tRNA ligase subunit beta [Patescibacteria group bacterium]
MSHKTLNQIIGQKLSEKEVHNILEDIGMELKNLEGDSLSIEITPDRLDLINVQGLSRAIKSFLKISKTPKYKILKSDYEVKIKKAVKDVRPHTVCVVIKNLNIDEDILEEIIAVQEKLHLTLGRGRTKGAIGIYPLETITWPVTYTADSPKKIKFKPLGSEKEMNGEEILRDLDTGKEFAHLLEGKNKYSYFIDAKKEILSMPPIINSEKTGRVNGNTKNIFIECSGFDLKILNELLINLTTMFGDMGGDIYEVKISYEEGKSLSSPNLESRERKLNIRNIKKLIGIDLSRKEIKEHLEKMMYKIKSSDSDEWLIEIPCFRFDIWHEVDIIDDIARSYGYNNIALTKPEVVFNGGSLPLSNLREELSTAMVGFGFLENYTFSLTDDKEQLENMNLNPKKIDRIKISNGMESQGMMRLSLIPQQLTTLFHNQNRSLPQKLFEGAFVVLPDKKTDVKARNEMHFCGLITDKIVSYTQIKQVLDALLLTKGLAITIKAKKHSSYIEGRCGEVFLGKKSIGLVGELDPKVLSNFGLQNPVGVFEINIEEILNK